MYNKFTNTNQRIRGVKMKIFKLFQKKNLLNKKLLIYSLTIITTVVSIILMSAYSYSKNIQHGLADNLIRLHVIANSDTDNDQAVKHKVRDEILKYMSAQAKKFESTDEAETFICSNLDVFQKIAEDTLMANGYHYEAKAYFGKYPFPTKVYGDVTLPAGEYQSLRVVLGNGSGANWWCVMFPPLCFVDASHGVVPDSSKTQLKNVLTDEEYKVVMSNSTNANSEVKFKFKIVEVFQQSKAKVASNKRQ